jgi:glutamate N-acetyltransferase/amino-acid N-acetyltransferase
MAGKLPVSPLAPAEFPALAPIEGARFAAHAAGVRYPDRPDVMLAVLDPGTTVAGVFTRSSTRSAPVLDCQDKLSHGYGASDEAPAAILVNAGNSNAFTGRSGTEAVTEICEAVSRVVDVPMGRVFTASTGVIGEKLPYERITAALDALVAGLSIDNLGAAAQAIRTTDTFPKGATATVQTEDGLIHISGIAKGSGMIAPDMATMLAYVFTDAAVPQELLQDLLSEMTATTFNAITVDSDTSTSDSLMLAATGKGVALGARHLPAFRDALHGVMLDLAHQIVRDGEGATKFVAVTVTGADTKDDARKVALAIANSPLVKTAIAGEDPNWGRIVMAVGKSGAKADRDALSIRFGDVLVAENGWVAGSYSEADGAAYMKQAELEIGVDLGVGGARYTAWTCDLTHGYISINADYRS